MLETETKPAFAFDPLVEEWFHSKFAEPTAPQVAGWPHIQSGHDVLISAPTGSGKTLAAFLSAVDRLVREARGGAEGLPNEIQILYVSPLKALVNDVQKNLEQPLAEITELAAAQGVALAPIRTALRTGDTPMRERAQMLAKTPHILVTTPESLFILLTAARSREKLRTISTIIVDEIHAMVGNKRGPHLALSLARLDRLVTDSGRPKPQRIGLSATVKPVEEVSAFLAGTNEPTRRAKIGTQNGTIAEQSATHSMEIVNIGHRRAMDLSVEVPQDELGPVASAEMWGEIYDRLAALILEHRTTLIFVSTRRLSERIAHNLIPRLGEGTVMPHHGSLARHIRMDTEAKLKNGELRAVVATASLELGIDIGSVDLVVQIGSSRSIAVALQRIGRSGHWVGAKPKGILMATTRDDLVECAAVVRAIRTGAMDRLELSEAPQDILAQQIVAACAADDWDEDELFTLVRSAYPYRNLERAQFDAVVDIMSEGIATSRGRAGTLLHRDRVNHRLRGRRGARLAAITSGGAIADTAQYAVVVEPEGTTVGHIDEDFAIESLSGDIFLLGTNSWRIRRVEQGRVRVDDAHGAPPTIPFWNGEAPGRTLELSQEVARLRQRVADIVDESGKADACDYLQRECGLDRLGAEQVVDYIVAGKAILGVVPTTDVVVAERFFDEAGGMQLVIHAPFGARINRAWGLALRKRFCRSFNLELQAAATDNGIVISLSEQHAFPLLIIFEFLKSANVEDVLTQAMLVSPMFTARWRWDAQRFLALLRFRGGKKVPANIQRMKADDLLAAVFPDQAACPENLEGAPVSIPDHPLVNEVISDCLHEAMDIEGLKGILRRIEDGSMKTVAIDTAEPSMFSHEILNANPFAYLDDAPLEERRARAVQLRSTLRSDVSQGVGVLDVEAIKLVSEESWPVVRDADELHDALLTLIALPPVLEWQPSFDELVGARRATALVSNKDGSSATFWVAAEKMDLLLALHRDAVLQPPIEAIHSERDEALSAEGAAREVVRGWLESTGPQTADALADRLAVSRELIEAALLQLENEGQVLRGSFNPGVANEWCNRRVLARIHRLTLGTLRREIEPVSTAQYMRFLDQWQHIAPGTQLHGVDGTLQIVKQLQGLEFPASAWETEILPKRVARYKPEYLDKLCASGEVMWGRLSPHPAFEKPEEQRNRRVRPSRIAPVSLFLRQDAHWLIPKSRRDTAALSPSAQDVLSAIEHNGAAFFIDLVRITGRLASEVEDGLWELVAAGLVTADGFDNLRALINPKRRLALGRRNMSRPRNSLGRWALLQTASHDKDIEAFARQLLARWGIVFRDVVQKETMAPAWRDLLVVLRRLEAQGEIRGGRFVASFVGEQFCQSPAIDLLRATRHSETASATGATAISAVSTRQTEPKRPDPRDPFGGADIDDWWSEVKKHPAWPKN
ncbi:MAG: DEAD/DEAH box helicase [Candidatus Eremiobacter antarcticus]|nr:DEAD/DEAH box helicase [Candidatus Eremiobacteraeota bacterium]MBC5807461.1 DEAD/DEAH box helicase [Candidatus Eremiobacteraeota bacterium]PZR61478.1 MAG: DEAD/DEAH box helicase [Candidatus Eremiobacter sp. RRmetagenome_bin22]